MKLKSKLRQKRGFVVGIDEVGRGPLAGPVAIGVVCVSSQKLGTIKRLFKGIRDSKQHTPRERDEWFKVIKAHTQAGNLKYCVSFSSNRRIDEDGIAKVIRGLIVRSLKKLKVDPKRAEILLDGGLKAPRIFSRQKTIIKGDEKIMAISIASVVAKVLRDRRMKRVAKKFPQYGFEIHKGYGTKRHTDAIQKYGLSEIHRITFCKRFSKF